jgi:ATP/maltotriose-dependent transcriptional regulator MalT
VALAAGDLEAAEAWLDAVGQGPEPRWYTGHLATSAGRVALLSCTADVRTARGETDEARGVLHEALEHAASADLVAPVLAVLVSTARYLRSIGDDERADRLLRYVRDHPRATFEARSAAAREQGGRASDVVDADDDGVDGVQRVVSEVMAALAAVSG